MTNYVSTISKRSKHETKRKLIEYDYETFLANGGKVQQIPTSTVKHKRYRPASAHGTNGTFNYAD